MGRSSWHLYLSTYNFNASSPGKKDYSKSGAYRQQTVPVASFEPNALQLYNMSGNIEEWCWDWYDHEIYVNSTSTNPKGAKGGDSHVLRGGAWSEYPKYCRVSYRNYESPISSGNYIGFRLARNTNP